MEFLKDFTKRMKSVGRFSVLLANSMNKTTWKQYGVETVDEQVNLLFTVLLYLMEQSLREETCTLDDIASFLLEVDGTYFGRSLSFAEGKAFADFIVNTILSNSGAAMYFQGFDYEEKAWRSLPINYVANEVAYLEHEVRRTSYHLTDEGYNMLLSTMEMENNLKLTIHEMLFRMHLEKADYGRAVHDMKNVFDRMRIQTQKIQEAMRKIRQNALAYTVEEYREIIEENLATLEETRERFQAHRASIERRVREYEEQEIREGFIAKGEQENLENLRLIEGYLNRTLEEHQKILGGHFDLKSLYTKELENYSSMTMVKRYHFRTEVYDRVLADAGLLERLHAVLAPLFYRPPAKTYHPGKALEYQKRLKKEQEEDEGEELGLDEAEYQKERERRIQERLKKYRGCLTDLMVRMKEENGITLKALVERAGEDERQRLFPTLEIFREVLIELLKAQVVNVRQLFRESREFLLEEAESFQLNEMLLSILEEEQMQEIREIHVMKTEEQEKVRLSGLPSEDGEIKTVVCANVAFWYI